MIIFHRVAFAYDSSISPILSDFSVQLQTGWTAITGPNGCGKTTLLKLACSVLSPTSGTIRFDAPKNSQRCYCEQNAVLRDDWHHFFWHTDSSIQKIFSLLQIQDDFPLRWDTLSGGEKKRLQIALALCENPALLALDEPTNHLDGESTHIILNAFRDFKGTGLLVSHSRFLMDSLCKNTLYLSFDEQHLYAAPVTTALQQRAEKRKAAQNEWVKGVEKVQRANRQEQFWIEKTAKTANKMSKSHLDKNDSDGRAKINLARLTGKDTVAAMTVARLTTKRLQNQKKLNALEKATVRKAGVTVMAKITQQDRICVVPAGIIYPQTGKADLTFETPQMKKSVYSLSIPDLIIAPSSRIALTGKNGSGKTLLIKHILSILEYKIDAANMQQNNTVFLPQEISAEQEKATVNTFLQLSDSEKGSVVSTLYRLGTNVQSVVQRETFSNSQLSAGELRKLLIALALQMTVSLIILDEPTNHLDIETILLLEEALQSCSCALLLCSHDSDFLKNLTTQTWHIERTRTSGILTIV